ncbi:MAG: DUF4864 domain-containing protein [Candidatus Didemnitutus sp.]|nr:DUF4864 domain-containing protein [Candidatus Didemnitutus sp.]
MILLLFVAAFAIAQADDAPAWRLSSKPVRDAVRATVEGQLDAIRAGKFDEAYRFAASGIQRQFSPAVFAAMLRRGYPAVVAHRRFELGVVRDDRGGRAQVVCVVFDAKNAGKAFRYSLVAEEGRWRIAGVVADSAEPDRPL